MKEIFQHIPPDIIRFSLVVAFSLLIGLEQRKHYIKLDFEKRFGTDRTFTLIGILGFILYKISPGNLLPFLGGGALLGVFLTVYYFQKTVQEHKFGFTSLITCLITYCIAPMLYTQPAWLVILIVVCVLVITELKESLFEFSQKFDNDEFITLAKFLVLAGVILPLFPDTPLFPDINITPYRFWLGVVAVSGISYVSYLLKKFVFPNAGILLTGILGGLYSSTATTVILAKKSREGTPDPYTVPAIILATGMMYLRIFLLALFFDKPVAVELLPYFAGFILLSAALAFIFWKIKQQKNQHTANKLSEDVQKNPLEFKTALIFAALFIFFAVITEWVTKYYGSSGIKILSFVVGVTDIDPFILNILQVNSSIVNEVIAIAIINAMTSNNILKLGYALFLSEKSLRKEIIIGFSVLILAGLAASFSFPLLHG